MDVFQALGRQIDTDWHAARFDDRALPEIASQALGKHAIPSHVDPWDVVRWVNSADVFPQQEDVNATFGNPPLTVFRASRFFISVLFWLDGTTSIHQHGFSGAYQVLMGSSLQSEYDFALRERIDSQLLMGDLCRKRSEILKPGDVREIRSGAALIHSLFHLDRPSATIVVRTYQDLASQPQYSYFRHGLAFDPFFANDRYTRRVQSLSLLIGARSPSLLGQAREIIERSDIQTTSRVLEMIYQAGSTDRLRSQFSGSDWRLEFDSLVALAALTYGDVAKLLPIVFDEQRRQQNIIDRREFIQDAGHRFFLALLMNGMDWATALPLVRQYDPCSDPTELMLNWIEELSSTRLYGSAEPNVLGVEIDDETLLLLDQQFRSSSDPAGESAMDGSIPDTDSRLLSLKASVLAPLFGC